MESRCLDTRQAARYLGLHYQTLCNWRMRRVGPPYLKLGKRCVYRLDDLEAFMKARRIDPTEEGISE